MDETRGVLPDALARALALSPPKESVVARLHPDDVAAFLDSAMQVARGGSYKSSPSRARLTARNMVPGFAFDDIGFRLCRQARSTGQP